MLTIDQSAAARRPDPARAADWLQRQRIFISSCMRDTRPERAAVAEAVEAAGATAVWFERFGRDGDPEEAYLGEVDSSSVYVAVLKEVYGRQDARTSYSATETEYRRAREGGKRIQVYLAEPAQREGPLRNFIDDRLRVFHTTEDFSDTDDLRQRVRDRLQTLAAEALSPWVKVGDLVFRAEEITDDGVQATVRAEASEEVVRALERLRGDDPYRQSHPTRFAYQHRVWNCQVAAVRTRVQAAGRAEVSVEFRQLTRPRTDPMRGGFNGIGPDELVEHGLRHDLFGEPLPEPLHGFGSVSRVDLDGQVLQQCFMLSNEIAPSITRLVLSDALVGAGKANAITDLLVGPRNRQTRRVAIEWEEPEQFGNQVAARRRIEGDWRYNPAA